MAGHLDAWAAVGVVLAALQCSHEQDTGVDRDLVDIVGRRPPDVVIVVQVGQAHVGGAGAVDVHGAVPDIAAG